MSKNNNYRIELLLVPECDEELDERQVMEWVAEMFRGCDMGKVFVMDVTELHHLTVKKDETVQEEADRENGLRTMNILSLFPLLRRGAEGPAVERLQHLLVVAGQHLVADGEFGPQTELKLKAFQRSRGLAVDGVAGPRSWRALEAARDAVSAVDPEQHGWAVKAAPEAAQEPPRPDFNPIVGNTGRRAVFGAFRYAPAPTPGNPEHIRFLDDWPDRNIVTIEVPQIAKIGGIDFEGSIVGAGPESGHVQVHRLVADQMKALWQAWEEAELLDRIITWAGMWSPRFIRGSRSVLSNHAFATAFDVNAPWNGLGREPARGGERGSVWELVPLAHEHGFFWGGHFQRQDGMHFEVAKIQ